MPVCLPCQRQQHERCDGCLVCQHRPTTPPPGGDDPATSTTPEKEHNA